MTKSLRAAAAAIAMACAVSTAANAIDGTQLVRCDDIDGIKAVADQLGYPTKLEVSEGKKMLLVATQGQNAFAIASFDVPELGGCIGLVMVAPFTKDNGSRGAIYNAFNASDINGFGAVALTFDGYSTLANSMITKSGTPAGNLALEIQLFAERTDAFAAALSVGIIARGKDPTAKGFGTNSPALSPAAESVARKLLKAVSASKFRP